MEIDDELKKKIFGKTPRAQTVNELQDRLQKKMAELRGNKGEGKKGSKKIPLTKKERKQKAKEAKKLQKKLLQTGKALTTKTGKVKPGGPQAKPVYNSEGKMVFSKFDFTEENGTNAEEKKKKLDPKSALQKIKQHKEKIDSLTAVGRFIFFIVVGSRFKLNIF